MPNKLTSTASIAIAALLALQAAAQANQGSDAKRLSAAAKVSQDYVKIASFTGGGGCGGSCGGGSGSGSG